ncbi:MAG: hypothetical protein J1E61_07035 [Lachnospiraceae bacterium]|nr:hypothetical protein [Lachnospiraceae bacterium]
MKGTKQMNNFILFLNTFFSYILVMIVVAVVAGTGMFIGIKMRKSKDAKAEAAEEEAAAEE